MEDSQPKFYVGVTGHRDADESDDLIASIERGLNEASEAGDSDTRLVQVVTLLSEGADTLVAEVAMSLNIPVLALLPLPLDDYRRHFSPHHLTRFECMLSSCEDIVLPPSALPAPECYQLAGERMLAMSDVLLALWDGRPAGGLGGTSDVVRMAKSKGKRVIVVPVLARGGTATVRDDRLLGQ